MDVYNINDAKDINQLEETILVLGYFDGMHLGHQELFAKAREMAKKEGLKIAVLTFPESPQLAFTKFHPTLLWHINSPEDRLKTFETAGVDFLYLIDFTSKFAKLTADEFITYYIKKLKAKLIMVGFDYRFASDQKDAHYLKEVYDGRVCIVPEFCLNEKKVSSTRIRHAIQEGNVAEANQLLGYTFSTRGLVVHGDARGRTIGYPTANMAPLDRVYLPADGVYIADVEISGKRYRGMASIGKNITFDGKDLRLEVHILDFDDDLYGQTLKIFWLDKIRNMVKFDGIEALVTELANDEEFARSWNHGKSRKNLAK